MDNEESMINAADLEILTCSVSDYASCNGTNPDIYELVGLNFRSDDYNSCFDNLKASAARKRCIAIVDAKYSFTPGWKMDQYSNRPEQNHLIATGLKLKKSEP